MWDAQSPWLIFLEFLTVAEACHREGRLLQGLSVDDQNRPEPLNFRPYKRMYLRNILYNNEEIFRIAEKYADRASGFTRIVKIGQRLGDSAPMVQIELV